MITKKGVLVAGGIGLATAFKLSENGFHVFADLLLKKITG